MLPRCRGDILEVGEYKVREAAGGFRSALLYLMQPSHEPLEVLSCRPHASSLLLRAPRAHRPNCHCAATSGGNMRCLKNSEVTKIRVRPLLAESGGMSTP